MNNHYEIVIVGAGPGGLSAAAQAAAAGVSHVLLEAAPHVANTLRNFQKAKHVMAEPANLPLRSPLSFVAGPRDSVLSTWEEELRHAGVNLRLNAQVTSLTGTRGSFRIELASGESLTASFVVLAVGLQGNIRRLDVPGDKLPNIQYQLDDPDDYRDETIVVVGAGDAGIENALALAPHNEVIVLNRNEVLVRCTEENFDAFVSAVKNNDLACRHDTLIERIEETGMPGFPLRVVARTPSGVEKINCRRIIVCIGADPPRQWLESFGVAFPNAAPDALPVLDSNGESSVPGLFVVGALAGYPLIKQSLNQGRDVVDRILGKPVEPVDEPMLREKLAPFCEASSTQDCLETMRSRLPLFAGLSDTQWRQVLLESAILTPRPGDTVIERNDYSTTFYSILEGEVGTQVPDWEDDIVLKAGDFFGEMGLISGRRRSATVKARTDCILIETPRRTMLRLLAIESVQRSIDQVAILRAIRSYIGVFLEGEELDRLVRGAHVQRYEAGAVLFREGDKADYLYLIRRGSVTISRMIGGREVVLFYAAAGSYVGDMALLSGKPRYATARAVGSAEVIALNGQQVMDLAERHPGIRRQMDERYFDYLQAGEEEQRLARVTEESAREPDNLIAFLQQGVGSATDVLLIDLSLCIRCDSCETACAATHHGASRLNRGAGPTLGTLHLPASCRHCEHPHCMKDCPPDAIHRSASGEVFIDDSCIGCGKCQTNCPYGVIQLAPLNPDYRPPSVWQLLFGRAESKPPADDSVPKKAVKCDMCMDEPAGPACVRTCPTGAALRLGPEGFIAYAQRKVGDGKSRGSPV